MPNGPRRLRERRAADTAKAGAGNTATTSGGQAVTTTTFTINGGLGFQFGNGNNQYNNF
jgi:hypothetical protein